MTTTVPVRVRSLPVLVEAIAAGGTQRDLARKVGVSPTSINLLATGKRHTTSVGVAGRIEDALGVPRGSLFALDQPDVLAPYVSVGAA